MENTQKQSDTPAQRLSGTFIEPVAANRKTAVWMCRVLAVFATVLACVYDRSHDSLTALAFGVLGFGIAAVLLTVHPGDREWVSSVVFGLVGLAIMKALFQIVGIEW